MIALAACSFQWLPIEHVGQPRNLMEAAVASIVEANVEGGMVDLALLAGVSWWVNEWGADENRVRCVVSAPDTLLSHLPAQLRGCDRGGRGLTTQGLEHFHFDSDAIAQALLRDPTATVTPLLSTVTYLSDGGGPTVICPDYDVDSRLVREKVPSQLLVSFPRANKHLAFDSLHFHGTVGPFNSTTPSTPPPPPALARTVSWREQVLQAHAAGAGAGGKKTAAQRLAQSQAAGKNGPCTICIPTTCDRIAGFTGPTAWVLSACLSVSVRVFVRGPN